MSSIVLVFTPLTQNPFSEWKDNIRRSGVSYPPRAFLSNFSFLLLNFITKSLSAKMRGEASSALHLNVKHPCAVNGLDGAVV